MRIVRFGSVRVPRAHILAQDFAEERDRQPQLAQDTARHGGSAQGARTAQEHNLVIHRQDSYIIRWLHLTAWPATRRARRRRRTGGAEPQRSTLATRQAGIETTRSTDYPSLRKHAR